MIERLSGLHLGYMRCLTGIALAVMLLLAGPAASAADKFLAPGFSTLQPTARLLVIPLDVELFELGAGGVAEPKADWTAAARQHMTTALSAFGGRLNVSITHLGEDQADAHAEALSLHAAVAESIALHHGLGGVWALPTKNGVLDWSFGNSFADLQASSGSDYALFTWVRDSYASGGRKAAMVALAMLGVGVSGGIQIAYATLVDLRTGRVVWFNHLARGTGDLREAKPAGETVEALLRGFPRVALP
ncbi:MAG: hypothetical protein H6950_13990 [Zoogloeaceae bacterium]|nr:hypothetical protein [Rhodocyclaceae bacterium]MCP5232267.1 hypothetical protein [Zoogloeaceae bacterium]MCP5256070.1 hypothetical protein [Zoogloeaceae bacterium]MCP5295792.1 hypothetical protein [Zoogloeaceae bacterium]MCW5615932.1 hypothetical protein [Rhodocyclaceae bacterium]